MALGTGIQILLVYHLLLLLLLDNNSNNNNAYHKIRLRASALWKENKPVL